MELIQFRNVDDFQIYKRDVASKRVLVENLIARDNIGNKRWNYHHLSMKIRYMVAKYGYGKRAMGTRNKDSTYLIGFCEACERESRLLLDWEYSNGLVPNFRERLVCEYCGLNNRQRFVVGFLRKLLQDVRAQIPEIYILEQVTKFYRHIKENLKNTNIVGSEYLGYDKRPGQVINNIRHEDSMNLSFADNSIDIIISNDVYEHVPDIQKALKEAYRILKNNGKLLISIPFHQTEKKTKQRAFIDNGNIVHLLPEQYHGNPLSEKGSLLFYDYGWDFLDFCKKAGFNDAYMLAYYSLFFGYLGDGLQGIFVAEKL